MKYLFLLPTFPNEEFFLKLSLAFLPFLW